jgi:hypothetical protein
LKRLRPEALGALLALASLGTAAPAAAQTRPAVAPSTAPAMVRYVVRPGDNLFRLASDYLIRPETYRIVQQLNHVADPLRLPIGMTLQIPRELLKHVLVRGTVLSMRGNVRLDGRAATNGMPVSEGALIETGQKSFVTLVLPDQTNVAVPSQSTVRVRRLRRVVLDSHVERLFAIEQGSATAQVTPMRDPQSTFQFATPGAVTSVRGTRFRMHFDEAAKRATSEVLEGKVNFDGGKTEQVLPAGFGSASDLGEPVRLLPPPELVAADQAQSDEVARFALRPAPVASAWHWQIAADEAFLKPVDEAITRSPEAQFQNLADGQWFVRATAIDANGLEGEPAMAAFIRQRVDRLRLWVEDGWNGPARQIVFHWDGNSAPDARFRFQLARPGHEDRPRIDRDGLSSRMLVGIALPAGRYRWRVQTVQTVAGRTEARWSDYQDVRIGAPW